MKSSTLSLNFLFFFSKQKQLSVLLLPKKYYLLSILNRNSPLSDLFRPVITIENVFISNKV